MELTTKQVHEAIDEILPFFVTESDAKNLQLIAIRRISLINPEAANQVNRVFSIMADNGLIKSRTMNSYALTEFGREIIENGGWLKHRKELDYENMLDRQTKELNLKHLKSSITQIKYWWAILIATAIAGGFFGELFDWLFSKP